MPDGEGLYDLLKERHSPGRAERGVSRNPGSGPPRVPGEAASSDRRTRPGNKPRHDATARFCPPKEIVEMKLEVNLSVYDELLSAESIDPVAEEAA